MHSRIKRFIASLAIFQGLLLVLHLAVYRTLEAAFGAPSAPWNTFFEWLFVALAFTFVSSSAISRRSRNPIAAAYYAFAAYWFGLISFLFVGAVGFFVIIGALYPQNIYVAPAVIGAFVFGAAFIAWLYSVREGGRAMAVNMTISLPGLPEAWHGRKIVFVSDVHLGQVRGTRFAAKVAEKIRSKGPYALFIGGDLYDGPACDETAVIAPFAELARDLPGGAWFVTGNHEYILAEPDRGIRAVRKAGIKVLTNEAVDLDGVTLVGVDDKDTHAAGSLRAILSDIAINPSRPSILLKHIPSDIDAAAERGISLELCGHTHNGQIFPFQWLVRRIFKGYGYGLHAFGPTQVYISSGVGTWGPPIRFGTRSEVICIEFR